jgi:bifunctional non-homologous end joining protein LigD
VLRSVKKVTTPKSKSDSVVEGVVLTHPERVLYPDIGITKRDLAAYYEAIAAHILPHVHDRPLSLVRCPEGMSAPCFYMKHAAFSTGKALRRVKIRESSKTSDYLVADSIGAIISLVQMSVLEIHTWNSHTSRLEEPDRVVFDLDPGPEVKWPDVVAAARLVRERLSQIGLTSFVKTTGGKGLHVVQPLVPGETWDQCFEFSRLVAESIAAAKPSKYTTAMPKAGREKKILLDYHRNHRGATSVSAFSTRSRPGAPVSMPVSWDELDDYTPDEPFTVLTVPKRLAKRKKDPWKDYEKSRRRLADLIK